MRKVPVIIASAVVAACLATAGCSSGSSKPAPQLPPQNATGAKVAAMGYMPVQPLLNAKGQVYGAVYVHCLRSNAAVRVPGTAGPVYWPECGVPALDSYLALFATPYWPEFLVNNDGSVKMVARADANWWVDFDVPYGLDLTKLTAGQRVADIAEAWKALVAAYKYPTTVNLPGFHQPTIAKAVGYRAMGLPD